MTFNPELVRAERDFGEATEIGHVRVLDGIGSSKLRAWTDLGIGEAQLLPGSRLANRVRDLPSIRDYDPSAGDGTNDATPAITAWLSDIRTLYASDPYLQPLSFGLPAGTYPCSNVDATNIRAGAWGIHGHPGSRLLGYGGKPVIDLTLARWAMLRDLIIEGDAADPPSIGLLMTPAAIQSGANKGTGNHVCDGLRVTGRFTRACLYNYGCEEVMFRDCFFNQYDDSPDSYAVILTADNPFGVVSDHYAPFPSGGGTFNGTKFVGGRAVKQLTGSERQAGSVVYISDAARVVFRDFYWNTTKSTDPVIAGRIRGECRLWSFVGHAEGSFNIFLDLVGEAGTYQLQGLEIEDHVSGQDDANGPWIRTTNVLEIQGLRARVPLSRPLFAHNSGTKVRVSGQVEDLSRQSFSPVSMGLDQVDGGCLDIRCEKYLATSYLSGSDLVAPVVQGNSGGIVASIMTMDGRRFNIEPQRIATVVDRAVTLSGGLTRVTGDSEQSYEVHSILLPTGETPYRGQRKRVIAGSGGLVLLNSGGNIRCRTGADYTLPANAPVELEFTASNWFALV